MRKISGIFHKTLVLISAVVVLSSGIAATDAANEEVFLSDLPGELFTVPNLSWDGYEITRDKTLDGTPLTIGGTVYGKGLWTHANQQYDLSRVVIDISGYSYGVFSAYVGIDDSRGGSGSCEFIIYGDGIELLSTDVISGGESALYIDADIRGVDTLTLVITNGADNYSSDWAVWGDAKLSSPYDRSENTEAEQTEAGTEPNTESDTEPANDTSGGDTAENEDSGGYILICAVSCVVTILSVIVIIYIIRRRK